MGKVKSWADNANCKDIPTELFFPMSGHNIKPVVREACAACPVKLDCLDHAVVNNEQYGIWGGINMATQGPSLRQAYRERLRQITFVKCKHPKTADNTTKNGTCIMCRAEAVKRYNEKQRTERTHANAP